MIMEISLYRVKNFFRGIKRYIRNLIRWSPMLWEDNDFDHGYLYNVILIKIKQMEKFWNSNKVWSLTKRKVKIQKDLKTCRILLERLIAEDYWDSAAARYKVPSYGKNKDDVPNWKFKLYVKRVDYLRKQDEELLFNLISKHISTWWD